MWTRADFRGDSRPVFCGQLIVRAFDTHGRVQGSGTTCRERTGRPHARHAIGVRCPRGSRFRRRLVLTCGEGERRVSLSAQARAAKHLLHFMHQGDMRTSDRGLISCEHKLLVCGRRSAKRAWAISCMMSAHSPRSFFWTRRCEAGQDQDEQRRLGLVIDPRLDLVATHG